MKMAAKGHSEKKDKKSKGKGREYGLPVQLTINNYIYQTDNLQVGDHNRQVIYPVDEAQTLLKNETEPSSTRRNDILMGMINSIINPLCLPNPDSQSIYDIKCRFKDIYKDDFEVLAGETLTSFLEKNKCNYELIEDSSLRMMVRPIFRDRFKKRKKKAKKKAQGQSKDYAIEKPLSLSQEDETEESLSGTETDYITAGSDYESGSTSGSSLNDSKNKSNFLRNWRTKQELQRDDTTDSDGDNDAVIKGKKDDEWQTVKRNKDRRKPYEICDRKKENTDDEERTHLLHTLLSKSESRDLIFRKSMVDSKDHHCSLILDIVSVWNTTSRTKSYIVFGVQGRKVQPHILHGIKHHYNMEFFHTIFDDDSLTSIPKFQYFETKYEGKRFGVMEIPSSFGAGLPIITKKKVTHNNQICFYSDQLWIRTFEGKESLSLSDPALGMVYQWFSGKQDKPAIVNEKELKAPIEKTYVMSTIEKPENEEPCKTIQMKNLDGFRNAVREFKKGQFILITGDMVKGIQNLEAVSMVPWLYVFDFDYLSRDSGILCSNEDLVKNKRSLKLLSWKQPPHGVSESGTVWTFMRGIRDHPETVFHAENAVRQWFARVKENLNLHIDQIQKYIEDYTVITIVMFWPFSEYLVSYMNKLLERIDEGIDPKPNIVLCMSSKPSSPVGESVLRLLQNDMKENLTVVEFDLEKILDCIIQIMRGQHISVKVKYELPTADQLDNPGIDDSEAAWLREELDVLYLSNPYTKCKQDIHALENEGEQFFRGGSLHWFAWYEVGAGHFDAERDLMESLIKAINININENRAGVVNLYHSPGAGGSTLAQRVLWEFHSKIPCAHVKIRSPLPINALVSRVEMMYEKTHKPVLLLLDGDDENKVRNLIRILKSQCYAIILYVKRYPYKYSCGERRFLEGTVSKREAKRLALKFKSQCKEDPKKQEQLESLCKDVECGQKHLMYEFGLAAYLHEYKGIEKYVKGYLWPSQKIVSDSFEVGRRILCYLSLAYYYGQTALPIQFFGLLLHETSNYVVEMEDLPHPVSEFIVMDKNECKSNNIRICHYLVAKEILEQVIGNAPESGERLDKLCLPARQNLAEFCKEFIDYASKRSVKSGNIVYVLTRIFIFRDNKDIGQNVEQNRKKPVLSRLMTDIYSKGPFFTERLEVLKKLTEAFPKDPNFHAHLGRFYAYCRPNEDEEAEMCLKKATEICEQQISGRKLQDLDERLLQSLMHVYHMYGTILQRRISRYTGQYLLEEPDIETSSESFVNRLLELLPTAKLSCHYFMQCRLYTPLGQETCFGLVGEITVRLQICDFIERKYMCAESSESSGIQAFLSSDRSNLISAQRFVRKSISTIDNLLMECFYILEEDDVDHSVQKVIFWYNNLFSKHAANLEELAAGDDIHSYRLQIAAKKLKYGCGENNLTLLEKINCRDDITKIVQLYENIFRDASSIESKSALDRDYIEWIFAIRHVLFEKSYSLEVVLQHIRRWHGALHSPMSKFYLFILTSLLGFGKNNANGSSEFLSEAKIIGKEMEKVSKFVLKPRYPREWLGKQGDGIKILEPGTRFLGYAVVDDRNLKEDLFDTLRVCKGTVCAPNNKRLAGYISLDLGNNLVPVRVFYIPSKAKLASNAYAEKRVEFILGFSLNHGYEAFNVRLLTKYKCATPHCSSRIEMTSDMFSAKCPGCQKSVHKSELNEVD